MRLYQKTYFGLDRNNIFEGGGGLDRFLFITYIFPDVWIRFFRNQAQSRLGTASDINQQGSTKVTRGCGGGS